MRRKTHIAALVAALALAGAACGGAKDTGFPTGSPSEGSPTETQTGPSDTVTIVAKDIAFDKTKLELKAETVITLTFDNRDAGTLHNVAIYRTKPASDENAIFRGELFNGSASKDYKVPATPAGTYYFQCDAHTTMNGEAVFS